MEIMYSSTRNAANKLTASQAILQGLAPEGGLYVPERIPALDLPLDELPKLSYQETAYIVMKKISHRFYRGGIKGMYTERLRREI